MDQAVELRAQEVFWVPWGRMRSCRAWVRSERGLGLSQCLQAIRCRPQFCSVTETVDSRRERISDPRKFESRV